MTKLMFENATKEINDALKKAFALGKKHHMFVCEESRQMLLGNTISCLLGAEAAGRLPPAGRDYFLAYAEVLLNREWKEQLIDHAAS